MVIGRNPDCDLVLTARDVSRVHAAIERDGEGWVIADLNSRYGTFVNQRRVATQRLKDGDQIALGGGATVLEFEVVPAASPEEQRVSFRAGSQHDKIRMTIGVEDLERRMSGSLRPRSAATMAGATGEETPGSGPESRGEPPPAEPQLPCEGVSLVGLFQQVGEVLLTSGHLDDMLGRVLGVAMGYLPAQRGFICLCDEAAENIVPKAARSKGLAQGESIAISRSIAREAIRSRQALLVDDAPADRRFALAGSVLSMEIRAAMCAPLYHAGRVEGLIYVDTRDADSPFVIRDLELLAALGVLTAVGILQTRLRDEVDREKAVFARLSRYSSPRVVEQIVASINTPDGTMLAAQREVSVLFADLSGFTSLAESREPAEVVSILNCAFEHLTRAIFQYDGTLDKFLGDGLLAVFGAPVPQADHAERAVLAALLMRQFLDECKLTGSRGEPLSMRIGINSGTAVAGDIGSPLRKDYTVVGDVVNVASRLQSSVANPGQIVIGPATYELCKHAFECEPLAEIRLKGKQQTVRPYLVVGQRLDTIT
jgi:adenylate cyclase